MTVDDYKTYLFEYDHDGSRWGFEIKAASIGDAEERVAKLYWARYVGELRATFPAPFGFIPRILCWFHNLNR